MPIRQRERPTIFPLTSSPGAGGERASSIVFDIGNVLIRWEPFALFRHFFDRAGYERFRDEVDLLEWNRRFDAGLPFADGVRAMVAAHPQHAAALQAFRTRWIETVPDAIEPNVALLLELRERGRPVYAITNFSAETWPLAKRRYPFLHVFRDTVVSGEHGVVKPDPAIFALLCERNGLVPERCLFVDDARENVEGARAFGMKAIHLAPDTDLRRELAAHGVA